MREREYYSVCGPPSDKKQPTSLTKERVQPTLRETGGTGAEGGLNEGRRCMDGGGRGGRMNCENKEREGIP